MFPAIALYLGAVNLATFLAFVWDKRCARQGRRRVPERKLLAMAVAGGSVGAVTAQRAVRHKTCKEPFRTYLQVIVWVQGTVFAALGAAMVGGVVGTAIT